MHVNIVAYALADAFVGTPLELLRCISHHSIEPQVGGDLIFRARSKITITFGKDGYAPGLKIN